MSVLRHGSLAPAHAAAGVSDGSSDSAAVRLNSHRFMSKGPTPPNEKFQAWSSPQSEDWKDARPSIAFNPC